MSANAYSLKMKMPLLSCNAVLCLVLGNCSHIASQSHQVHKLEPTDRCISSSSRVRQTSFYSRPHILGKVIQTCYYLEALNTICKRPKTYVMYRSGQGGCAYFQAHHCSLTLVCLLQGCQCMPLCLRSRQRSRCLGLVPQVR